MAGTAVSTDGRRRNRGEDAREAARLVRASWAFTTRRVHDRDFGLLRDSVTPRAGDLLLARVDAIGHHAALQLPSGRRRFLFVGDEIVVAYGNRYAPNQFEAVVPKTLGPCQLVAGGGVAGKALSWHTRVTRGPTQITPIGLLATPDGEVANLRSFAVPALDVVPASHPIALAVAGTAMDSGKTQTCAHLVRGLKEAGLKVGYAKITGTGSGGDTWLLRDAGARPVLDFTDAGYASTYMVPPDEVERVLVTLVGHLAGARVEAIVLEIADGVLQAETAALLVSPSFRRIVGGILFAASDAMGAAAGEAWLRERGLPVLALGGVLTAAPLQREECLKATGIPVYSRQDLARPKTAVEILSLAERMRPFADTAATEAPAAEVAAAVEDALPVAAEAVVVVDGVAVVESGAVVASDLAIAAAAEAYAEHTTRAEVSP